jgi:hypothetical protein
MRTSSNQPLHLLLEPVNQWESDVVAVWLESRKLRPMMEKRRSLWGNLSHCDGKTWPREALTFRGVQVS